MAGNRNPIVSYMQSCMKDMSKFACGVEAVAGSPAGRHFMAHAQPPGLMAAVRGWWWEMEARGSFTTCPDGFGGSDWSIENYADSHVHDYVRTVYVDGFRPELLLSVCAYGTAFPKSIAAVFGVVGNSGVCTVFLKRHCFFHALWLLYAMYVEEIVRSLFTVNTFGRVYLEGQSGCLSLGKPEPRLRFAGGQPCSLLDFPEPVVMSVGADDFYLRSYEGSNSPALAVSMNLDFPLRVPAFKSRTPSLFDII